MSLYRPAEGVTLQENKDHSGGVLTVLYPRRIIRLSQQGVKAFQFLCGSREWEQQIQEQNLAAFATGLEEQGILIRVFPILPDELLPEVSVVIPTYNRQEMLVSCIQSVLALDYPVEKLEVIVVDDGSPVPVNLDHGLPIVRTIRMRRNEGPGAARNEAVKQAKGEIIAFLDDDCCAEKNWLRELVPCFVDSKVVAAGGQVDSASLTRPLDRYERSQSPLAMGDRQCKVRKGGQISYLPTCNLLVRKESFTTIGGFAPQLRVGEDVDLSWRLLEHGGDIYYFPRGIVFHKHRSGLMPFLKRRFHYGQSEAKLHSRHPGEKRRLNFFPGSGNIFFMAMIIWLTNGFPASLAAGLTVTVLNILWRTLRKFTLLKPGGPRLHQIFLATVRSQGAGLYLVSEHFSRYYSLPSLIAASIFFHGGIPLLLAIHYLKGITNYTIKRPYVHPVSFIFYHLLEDIFYQAGVYSGCVQEKQLGPLKLELSRAQDSLMK